MDMYDPVPAQRLMEKHHVGKYPLRVTFGGLPLVIEEDVFCPVFTNTSSFLLDNITLPSGRTVLDVFSGSGAFAIVAAASGNHTVAIDISQRAIQCIRKNAILNRVEHSLAVRHGTMSQAVLPGEKFDLIIANPPLLPGNPTGPLAAAIWDPGLQATYDFVRRVPAHLQLDGRAYILTSDVLDRCGTPIGVAAGEVGLSSTLVNSLDMVYETYRVHLLQHGRTE